MESALESARKSFQCVVVVTARHHCLPSPMFFRLCAPLRNVRKHQIEPSLPGKRQIGRHVDVSQAPDWCLKSALKGLVMNYLGVLSKTLVSGLSWWGWFPHSETVLFKIITRMKLLLWNY